MNKNFWKNVFFNKYNEPKLEDLMHIAIATIVLWIALGYFEIVDIPLITSLKSSSS